MKKSRFTENQIVAILSEAEAVRELEQVIELGRLTSSTPTWTAIWRF